jgi:hypothetical protein
MNDDQPPDSHPVMDPMLVETQATQLRDRHHAVLAFGHNAQFSVVRGALVAHIATSAPRAADHRPRATSKGAESDFGFGTVAAGEARVEQADVDIGTGERQIRPAEEVDGQVAPPERLERVSAATERRSSREWRRWSEKRRAQAVIESEGLGRRGPLHRSPDQDPVAAFGHRSGEHRLRRRAILVDLELHGSPASEGDTAKAGTGKVGAPGHFTGAAAVTVTLT